MSKHRADVEPDAVPTTIVEPGPTPSEIEQTIERILENRLNHMVADVERRLAMAYEVEGGNRNTVHSRDLNISQHIIEGYTVTANSPGAGSIAWASVHIVYNGVDYTIADGNTANRYVWFVKPGSYTPGTPVTLSSSNTQPTLATGDSMIFINNSGVPISALESGGVAPAVGPSSVGSTAIIAGAVGTTAIADDAVTNAKVGPAAVGTTEIADDAVNNAKIGPAAVGTGEIADDAVTNAKVGPSAVGNTELADGAVGSTKLGAGAVTPTRLNILQHVMF